MIRDDERYWANMVIGAIDNLERPMLMFENEKMIVRKALKAYLEDRKTSNGSEKSNNCKTQTNADQHVQRVEYVEKDEKSHCWECKYFERMHETPIASDGRYYTYVVCTAKECHYEPKTEPQICSVNGRPYSECGRCEFFKCTADEPQTERGKE